jgi:hypothetical protein
LLQMGGKGSAEKTRESLLLSLSTSLSLSLPSFDHLFLCL